MGRVEGGKKTAAKNKLRDPEFYSKIGKLGGAAKVSKGFGKNRELASRAGRIGGAASKPGKKIEVKQEDSMEEDIEVSS